MSPATVIRALLDRGARPGVMEMRDDLTQLAEAAGDDDLVARLRAPDRLAQGAPMLSGAASHGSKSVKR